MAKGRSQTYIGLTGSVGDVSVIAQGEETLMRRRPGPNGSESSGQVAQRSLTAHLGEIWAQMSLEERGLWAALQAQLGYRTAYLCYSSVSKVAINTGGVFSPSPPSDLPPPPLSTDLQVQATNNGSVFSVRIVGPAYDAAKVRVFATVGVPALGATEFKAASFKPICVLQQLGTFTGIGAEYAQKFGKVAAGGKIGFKLQAVTASGLTGNLLFRDAIVTLPTAAEGADDDEQLQAA